MFPNFETKNQDLNGPRRQDREQDFVSQDQDRNQDIKTESRDISRPSLGLETSRDQDLSLENYITGFNNKQGHYTHRLLN